MTSTPRLDPGRPAVGRVRRARTAPAEDFRTPVRGHAFAARPPDAPPPAPGAAACLVREPDNPRDHLAVAVWTDGDRPWRLGYLDRAVAARLAPRLDAGQRFCATLAGWVDAPGAGWRRPLLRITTDDAIRAAARRSLPPYEVDGGLWGRPPGSTRRVLSSGR